MSFNGKLHFVVLVVVICICSCFMFGISFGRLWDKDSQETQQIITPHTRTKFPPSLATLPGSVREGFVEFISLSSTNGYNEVEKELGQYLAGHFPNYTPQVMPWTENGHTIGAVVIWLKKE